MHILFVHKNYPAQFGHIAHHLATRLGHRCTFVSERPPAKGPVERIQYTLQGGATNTTHYCSRTFENAVWHSEAVFNALKARPDIKPDLIVGHSGFASCLYLRELYDAPIVNYFEYFYHTSRSDMDFLPDFPCTEIDRLRARTRNAMLLLDLETCDVGYSPTRWQRSRLPESFRDKVRVVFDGIDTDVWKPQPNAPRKIGGFVIPDGVKVVTYATRGMESMRGFHVFMKAAHKLSKLRDDVVFIIAGEDRVCYGNDEKFTGGKTFKEWVLSQDDYDLSRFVFTGLLPITELARLFSITNIHFYLTTPFILSWSLMDALACGATVLASDTAPVREVIAHGENGLLVDFFDVDGFVSTAMRVLDAPARFRDLGMAGVELVRDRYSLKVCLPQVLGVYQAAAQGRATKTARPGP